MRCSAQVQHGVRIKGSIQTSDTVGTLVWARSPNSNNAWWPAEVLDPFFMPFSHTLPPASLMGKLHCSMVLHLEHFPYHPQKLLA